MIVYPCFDNSNFKSNTFVDTAFKLLVCICLLLAFAVYSSIDINAPFNLATSSRALYVDEGFYSDAAQNLVKFGQMDLHLDSRHWPGAPLLSLIQSLVFSVFGVSAVAAKMISVFFGIISCLSIYAIARYRLPASIAFIISLAGVLSFTFMAHTRAAITDPVALGLSLAALAVYVRMNRKIIAITLSLFLSYLAFCAKMYYLYSLVTISSLWFMELIVLALLFQKNIDWKRVAWFFASILLILLSYVCIRLVFSDAFADFFNINSNKKPNLNPLVLYKQLIVSLQHIPKNTNNHIFIGVLVVMGGWLMLTRFWSANFKKLAKDILLISKDQWGLMLFLSLGLITASGLNKPDKAHYYYYLILPITYLSISWLYLLLPKKHSRKIISVVFLVHLAWQSSYYFDWLQIKNNTSINLAGAEIMNLITQEYNNEEVIPVIGEYAAQLSLYNKRMLSLDARWLTQAQLCERLYYWRPKFHVHLEWPKSAKRGVFNWISACKKIKEITDISRIRVFEPWQDELVLTRLYYSD